MEDLTTLCKIIFENFTLIAYNETIQGGGIFTIVKGRLTSLASKF